MSGHMTVPIIMDLKDWLLTSASMNTSLSTPAAPLLSTFLLIS